MSRCVVQDWVWDLPLMQQTTLLSAIRGPDGVEKYHSSKFLLRWYRRCILLSALDGEILETPFDKRGGSFTGPSYRADLPHRGDPMGEVVNRYIKSLDGLPHHFIIHFQGGVQILGYKHPRAEVREWWYKVYVRLVKNLHCIPESKADMEKRLGDRYKDWASANDSSTLD